jgi:peptide-methionine (S)-S-oxide reductase
MKRAHFLTMLTTLVGLTVTVNADPEAKPTSEKPTMETATLGAGCFWCIEAALDRVKGVEKAVSGYTGGKSKNPTYEEICTGLSGHAEVVQVTYDPKVISFETLLNLFFELHDPTTLNAQWPDTGTQYRSGVWYHNDAQKAAAEKAIKAVNESGKHKKPVVTEVTKLDVFYPAEAYHQDYFDTHMPKETGNYRYLCNVVAPKVDKLKKLGVELKEKK